MSQGFTIGALGPTLSAQCATRGYVAKGLKIELVDDLARSITMLHVHGLISDLEYGRAARRLFKAARLTQVLTFEKL